MLGLWFVASSKLSSSSSAIFLVKVFFAEELQLGLSRVSRVYKITNSKRFGTIQIPSLGLKIQLLLLH
jgi:hypothetical protein